MTTPVTPYRHDHLPEVAISMDEIHPFLRPIISVGRGDFRACHIGGIADPVIILAHNTLYPHALYLHYDREKGYYSPALMGADGKLHPVSTLQAAAIWLPGLANAYAQAIKNYHPNHQPNNAA